MAAQGNKLFISETPGERQGPAPASGCVWAGCHSLLLPCCLPIRLMGGQGACFRSTNSLLILESSFLWRVDAFGKFLSSERCYASVRLPFERSPLPSYRLPLQQPWSPTFSCCWCVSLAGAQVVEKISLPYFATSLSLSPAARFVAVGFDGEYWRVLWALLPRLPCPQVAIGPSSQAGCQARRKLWETQRSEMRCMSTRMTAWGYGLSSSLWLCELQLGRQKGPSPSTGTVGTLLLARAPCSSSC